ncbi:GAF domain-containing protein [Achromobacter insuavis]|uniref:GAF domain-containing protein n=1 Tax=Achromobacter insuavis TaxID=1287735 RepID=UPI003B9CE224
MHATYLPGAQRKRFWQKKWPREVLFSGPPILVAGSAAAKNWRDPVSDPWTIGLAITVCLWLALAAGVRVAGARAEDRKGGPDVVHEGLYAAVCTMHTMLSEWCNKRQCGADIRATFHRVVPPIHEPREIEQIIDYAGANGEGAGRTFPIHTGITGRAIRSRTPLVMSSPHATEQQLRTELIREWGYTEAEVRRLGPGRYLAMAVPVLDRSGQHPIGVIYLDSSDRALFERDDVVEIVGVGTKAISDFVTKRY